MEKIPTLYVRDYSTKPPTLTDEVTPGCEWVLAGEGLPTRKYDGTCCMVDQAGDWYFRREIKAGTSVDSLPAGFIDSGLDRSTGKRVGWEPAENSGFRALLAEALAHRTTSPWPVGTYELCGPKINGNPEGVDAHVLVRHEMAEVWSAGFADGSARRLVEMAAGLGWEGIVWHHPDGRMAKLKARDIGVPLAPP